MRTNVQVPDDAVPIDENRKRLTRQVLEDVAQSVESETPFRRVLATCYLSPLIPEDPSSKSTVLAYATRGLSLTDRETVERLVEGGAEANGGRYQGACRIGRSYFLPDGAGPTVGGSVIQSGRRYLQHGGWTHSAALLVPFWHEGRILGHISVDDPSDGRRPDARTLAFLEELASVAGIALREACSLETLHDTHHLFRFLVESGMTGVAVVVDDQIEYANRRAVELLGYDVASLQQLSPWWNFIHPEDRELAKGIGEDHPCDGRTLRAIGRDGGVLWLSMCADPMVHKGREGLALHFHDVSERVHLEEELREKALRDPLTGLRNRAFFDDMIQLELFRSQRYGRTFTLMLADLRQFKAVNDTLGHQQGDRVLASLAEVLVAELRKSDWVVRYGGDEFLLVLPETGSDIQPLVERLRARIESWMEANVPGRLGVSIDFGWATWTPNDPRSINDLLKAADEMLYREKRA
ncbi:MAG: diguanylate cyclase [Candidatus Bipolaricaulota bacterium]|nr:MAG: diguanylate cyclase [Candidatus Bipolaricaulota bacterium]